MNNFNLLNETLEIVSKGYYYIDNRKISLSYTHEEHKKAVVFLPDMVNGFRSSPKCEHVVKLGSRCNFSVVNSDSFSAITDPPQIDYKLMLKKNTTPYLVLNFASPIVPGGSVFQGGSAQEETLCKKSTLLSSLSSSEASMFYNYHESHDPRLASDAMILSPNVEIIRDKNNNLLECPIKVAVLTCSAPNANFVSQDFSAIEYENLLYNRILGIISFASTYNYKKLILGAWGCGSYGNDAKLVSDMFFKAFKSFKSDAFTADMIFDVVTFAVLDKSSNMYNYRRFQCAFSDYYHDVDNIETQRILQKIHKKDMLYLDKIQGSLIGGAVGDALGYPVEFSSYDSIKDKYGKFGITAYDLSPISNEALISDDTQMTLFTANGLLVGDTRGSMRGIAAHPSGYVREAYLDWMKTQGYETKSQNTSWLLKVKKLHARRAPGRTCQLALLGPNVGSTQNEINESKGCGGLMRVAPVGLFYNFKNIIYIDEIGAEIAAITHGHPLGYISAAVLTHIINRIVYGGCKTSMSLVDIILEAMNTVSEIYCDKPHIDVLNDILLRAIRLSNNHKSDYENIKTLGKGWVAEEALAIAIYCSLRYPNNFSKAVIASVNHDGDSDSTGAVTGNIVGAIVGYSGIESCWKNNLELRDVILEIASDLCHGCQMNEYSHYNDQLWSAKYY